MEVSDEESTVNKPNSNFRKPEHKPAKYKPRKSVDLERELTLSDMEFVTSVQVDERQEQNSRSSSRSTMSQLSQGTISFAESFEISGVNPLENSIQTQATGYTAPRIINKYNFDDKGSKEGSRNMKYAVDECLIKEVQDQKEKIELSESLMNFVENFEQPKFEVDWSVLDKFKNQPTFEDIFKKADTLQMTVKERAQRKGRPFYEWLENTKDRLRELSRQPVLDVSK